MRGQTVPWVEPTGQSCQLDCRAGEGSGVGQASEPLRLRPLPPIGLPSISPAAVLARALLLTHTYYSDSK